MITADADFVFYEGSKAAFTSLAVQVDYAYEVSNSAFLCILRAAVISTATTYAGEYTYRITKASVDAKTGTGTNPSDKLLHQIEQVIIDYLDAITENAAVTFTH